MNNETLDEKQKNKIDENTVVEIFTSMVRVSRCLLMCAPRFAEGSEGAIAVNCAQHYIPLIVEILRSKKEEKGGAK